MSLFCSYCGSENPNGAVVCTKCDARIGHVGRDRKEGESDSDAPGSSSFFWIATAGICVVYLVNPGAGFLEFIPDNFPVIGNLDEAAATAGLLLSLSNLGLNPFSKTQADAKQQN